MTWPILERPAMESAVELTILARPPRAVLLRGASGVGKTTIARRVAGRCADRAMTPLAIVGLAELRGVPLAPFLPVLPALGVRRNNAVGLTARELIGTVGGKAQEVVLVVDDAPLLDDTSAAVVYQLVRAFAVPTILTARTEHTLTGPIKRLAVEGALDVTDVRGFARAETDDVLRRHLGTTARPDDVTRLQEQTGGNPLHLREVVALAERRGLVRRVGAGMEIHPVDLPRGVYSSIADRLATLDEGAWEALRLVAFGSSASRTVLIREEDAGAVDTLVDRGLVEVRPEGVLHLSHPSISEVVAEGLSAAERERVVTTVAERLEASGTDELRFAAVRLRCGTAGGPARTDVEWAVRRAFGAGEHLVAHELAARLRRDFAGRSIPFGVLLDEASALSALGRLDEADAAFTSARSAATTSADTALLVSRWGTHLAYRRFDVTAALNLAGATAAALSELDRAALAPEVRTWQILDGQLTESMSQTVDRPEIDGEAAPEVALRGAIAAVMLDSMSGRVTGEAADVLVRVQREQGILDPLAAAMVHLQRYFILLSLGQGDAAAAVCEEQRVVASPDAAGMWSLTLGLHRMYGGRLTEARALAELAVEQLRWRDPLGFLGFARALQANVEAQRGETAAATVLLDDLLPVQLGDPKTLLQAWEARAYLAALAGDPDAASELAIGACRGATKAGHDLVAAISLAVCIRVGRAADALPLLQEIVERVGPGLGLYTALRDVALALTEHRPGLVRDAARRLAAAGMNAAAADALRHAETWALPVGSAAALTAREREVVDLVRQRLSSPEIAERLVVSVRTVDNHLAKVYRKLGVSGRAELRVLLDESSA